jgi:hypothetical protein
MPKSRRRLQRMAAVLLLSCAVAPPATARFSMHQPKVVADLQLMTASELGDDAAQACLDAVGSWQMANNNAAIQMGKRSAYLDESQEHRDYLSTVLRVLRAKLGREPLWMVEFRRAALGQDLEACGQVHKRSLKDTVKRAPR